MRGSGGRRASSSSRHMHVGQDLDAQSLSELLVLVEQDLTELHLRKAISELLKLGMHCLARTAPARVELDDDNIVGGHGLVNRAIILGLRRQRQDLTGDHSAGAPQDRPSSSGVLQAVGAEPQRTRWPDG